MLRLDGVHKRLGGRDVLTGVELLAGSSEVVVISGPNGSGKSTLLRIICGLLDADSGKVEICGYSMRTQAPQAKAQLGYAPDGLEAMPELLASELVALVRAFKGREAGPASLSEHWKQRLGVTAFWDQRLAALSFGQRKRVAILTALCGAPQLLLLDEPTNGLDAEGVDQVSALLDERRSASLLTVLSTNDLAFAETVDGAHYRMQAGRLSRLTPGQEGGRALRAYSGGDALGDGGSPL